MNEYRQNDETRGWCPKCGNEAQGVTVHGSGVCDEHGRVWVNWTRPVQDPCPDCGGHWPDKTVPCPSCELAPDDLRAAAAFMEQLADTRIMRGSRTVDDLDGYALDDPKRVILTRVILGGGF